MNSATPLFAALLFLGNALATEVTLNGMLICSNPFRKSAVVFLMERDFSGTVWEDIDEDDVLDQREVPLNENFTLFGTDSEISALELYLWISYNCNGKHVEKFYDLGEAKRRRNFLTATINLETHMMAPVLRE